MVMHSQDNVAANILEHAHFLFNRRGVLIQLLMGSAITNSFLSLAKTA